MEALGQSVTPEQIIEVQRNLAWDALEQKEAEANIAKAEIARLNRKLKMSVGDNANLRAKLEELERQAVRT